MRTLVSYLQLLSISNFHLLTFSWRFKHNHQDFAYLSTKNLEHLPPVQMASGETCFENEPEQYGPPESRQRFPGLYVGNLTWWTTDQDVINSINSIGVRDVQEVKFFENRNNGQSKGFCVVTFGSDTSLPIVMEKLPKLELYGQNPVVTPYNRQNLNLFESQTKARLPMNQGTNGPNHAAGIMGISSISGVHAGTQGLPYSGMNTYGAGAGGVGPAGGPTGGGMGPRNPMMSPYNPSMRFLMRTPRPLMRGPIPGAMNNGPAGAGMMQQMTRVRFMHPMDGRVRSDHRYRSDQRGRSRSRERSPDRSRERSRDRSRERSPDRSHERSPDRSHERSHERSRDRSRERTHDRSHERSHERTHERTHDRSRERKERRDRRDRY